MRRSHHVGWLVLAGVAALLFFAGPGLTAFYVDWLWFGEVGQRRVFWALFNTRLMLGLVFGLALAALVLVNVAIARKLQPPPTGRMRSPEWARVTQRFLREGFTGLVLIGALALGALGGTIAAARWDEWLRFAHSQTVGIADPIFHRDVGFYLFQYPFLRFVNEWLFGTLLVAAVAISVVYYLNGAVSVGELGTRIAPAVRAHVSVLLGLAMLSKAWDYRLDQYGLLLEQRGVLFGAGYADAHARIPALGVLAVVALIAAAGFFWNARARVLWLPGVALALMLVASLTVGGIYPGLVQRFQVVPNQQARERPYLNHHLQFTRAAYGLDRIGGASFPLGRSLAATDLAAESGTLANVRLWDYKLLSRAQQQLQHLRNYYDVSDVDVDRYPLAGQNRQVMLAARELVPEKLDPQQQTWVNRTLQYTHGYGLVMSRVNEVDAAGRPVWLAHDLPLETAPDLKITRPEVYFGLRNDQPVIAPSGSPEIDYPLENGNSTSSYSGGAGIPIGAPWLRWVFSAHQGDWNILISDLIRPESRILLRRTVPERIQAVAPFLRLDHDPYLAAVDGKLVWLQDAYTVASTYPYSAPTAYRPEGYAAVSGLAGDPTESFNYIRNSVKATVDAYTGEVRLYAIDDGDAVLRAYRKAFPSLFRPAEEITGALRAHLRYPENLFYIQARKLLRYHVTDPDVFYQGSDQWDLTTERRREGRQGEDVGSEPMEPYYVVMRLPGETREEFVLFVPFKPKGGTTLVGWLAARCDGADYGQLRLYRFPANSQVDTPEQVDNSIRANAKVSPLISLLTEGGSAVHYGSFLVLPAGQSLLYVKPLFVQATQQGAQEGIPELKQVILAERRGGQLRVVMEPTFREALAALVGSTPPADEPTPSAGSPPPQPGSGAGDQAARLAADAEAAFQGAERALKSGNWAEYGRQVDRARDAIRRLRPLLK